MAALKHFEAPVEVKHITAQVEIDIGDTSIGMHVQFVQVPVRPAILSSEERMSHRCARALSILAASGLSINNCSWHGAVAFGAAPIWCNKIPAFLARKSVGKSMMGGQGIEPWTHGLRVRCSAS